VTAFRSVKMIYLHTRTHAPTHTHPFGPAALNTHPVKSHKNHEGERNIEVRFGGVTFKPGQWLYSDSDGIIVSDEPLKLGE